MIIGLDLEETILSFGAPRVTLVANVNEALEKIAAEPVTIALLDLSLGGRANSVPVAEKLFAANVPFAFLTGYSDPPGIPPELAAAPILGKPLSTASLLEAIRGLLQGAE
jgi:DNA-binding response OmpR family regulator